MKVHLSQYLFRKERRDRDRATTNIEQLCAFVDNGSALLCATICKTDHHL